MTEEEIKIIVERVYSGEYQYEKLRETKPFNIEMPPWNELTEEQKTAIRIEQDRYNKEVSKLAEDFMKIMEDTSD